MERHGNNHIDLVQAYQLFGRGAEHCDQWSDKEGLSTIFEAMDDLPKEPFVQTGCPCSVEIMHPSKTVATEVEM
jgi:hypothetical protein